MAIIVMGAVGAIALVTSRAMGRSSAWRWRIPGIILVGLGLALFGSQASPTSERLLFGLATLVAWGGTGLALVAGRRSARVPGLVVSGVGLAVACWLIVRIDAWANGPPGSADRVLVDLFFLADGPFFSWIEVGTASMAFATMSAVAGGFLLAAGPPLSAALGTDLEEHHDATGEVIEGSDGGPTVRSWGALLLAAVGTIALAAALWNLVTVLPRVLGAAGTHMAGDARFYVMAVIGPLAVLAFVLLAGAWAGVRRRERSGRLAAAAMVLAGATVIASAAMLALPVLPPETLIPANAVRVHVTIAGGALTLTPSTVRSGPVYLLIDDSAANVLFVGRAYATQEEIDAHGGDEPGPLSDAEVDAISRGDMYLTSTVAGLGDVARWDLLPGRYVVATDDPGTLAARGGGRAASGTLAVLTVIGDATAP